MHFEVLNVAADILSMQTPAAPVIPNPVAEQPPGGGGVLKILGWGAWIVFGLAVLGLFGVAAQMMIDNKAGRGGGEHTKALMMVLAGCIIAAVASGIVGAVVTAAGGLA